MEWRIRGNEEGGWEGVSLTEWAASPKSLLLPPSKVTEGRNGSLKEERRERYA